MPGIAGASRPGAAMAHRKRRGNRKRAQHGSMARAVFAASRHVCRAHRGNAWRGACGRARRREPSGHAWRAMPPGHGLSCERHFHFPLRSVNGWKEAAGHAVAQAPRRRAAGSRGRRCAPGRVERWGADQTSERAHSAGVERAGARLPVAGKGRLAARTVRPARAAHHARGCAPANASVRPSPRTVMCRRTCTVRLKWLGTVSGPGRGSGLSSYSMARRAGNGMACIGIAPHGRGGEVRPANARRVETAGVCGGAGRRRVGGAGRSDRAGRENARENNRLVLLSSDSGRGRTVPIDSRYTYRYRESNVNSSSAPCNRVASTNYTPDIRVAPNLNATF